MTRECVPWRPLLRLAVALRRKFADMTGRALGGRLSNLRSRLSDLGSPEERLATIQESVARYRRVVETRPATLPSLASSLHSLGKRLFDLGRCEEALAATQESVSIKRHLAETRPDGFQVYLAAGLDNVGVYLSGLGRREEALAASQESVSITRRLVETQPDSYVPDLAISLHHLGNRLSELGDCEGALAAYREAVAIRRRLAETDPHYRPYLARSLEAQGQTYVRAERHADAAEAFHEGLMVIMPSVEGDAEAHSDVRDLRQSCAAACKEARTAPDAALLERVARAIDNEKKRARGSLTPR